MNNHTTKPTPAQQTFNNAVESLQEAYKYLNLVIFCDDLPYHMIVPRKTRAFKYGDLRNTTHELPVNPEYYCSPEHVIAELLHQMWHVWQHQYGNPPEESHKGHYHNVELQEKLRECGLEPITDPLTSELLSKGPIRLGK